MNGKVIKQMPLSKGQGSVNVDASALSNGTYNYSLVVDGKKIETKEWLLLTNKSTIILNKAPPSI